MGITIILYMVVVIYYHRRTKPIEASFGSFIVCQTVHLIVSCYCELHWNHLKLPQNRLINLLYYNCQNVIHPMFIVLLLCGPHIWYAYLLSFLCSIRQADGWVASGYCRIGVCPLCSRTRRIEAHRDLGRRLGEAVPFQHRLDVRSRGYNRKRSRCWL